MKAIPVEFQHPVTLVGGGTLDVGMLHEARALAPELVAADGAADRLAAWGLTPAAVVGDMDSLADPAAWRSGPARFVEISEQETTDFEKCLYATEAPFYVAAGFTGRRADHMLAVFHAMLARPAKRVVLLSEDDAIALVPPDRTVRLSLAPGARVSLFPMLPVRGVASHGLKWPIDGLELAPGRQIGTSNAATGAEVAVHLDGPGALLMVERRYLAAMIAALFGVG